MRRWVHIGQYPTSQDAMMLRSETTDRVIKGKQRTQIK